ncbi:MAG: alpha/beta fold hydrolase [Candidatus Eremiobacteraeota bacterium]|nr:alpha/beta fold hydrolase [Candidatus Eremiobacteraeota bacterium]
MFRKLLVVAGFAAALSACTNQTSGLPNAQSQTRLHLQRCFRDGFYCAAIRRPIDPSGQVAGTVDIAFAWLPHSQANLPAIGTIVAVEGGPGYPSIGSRSLYRRLFAPLLTREDMLLVDNRGTGRSDAIDCTPLQIAPVMRLRNVARCGAQLGATADLFGTALAADDLAAILAALNAGRVDLYGDSYGTFFVQAFAGRHPQSVRSIVLDAAYPVVKGDPWYPSTGAGIRDAFDIACRRSPVCSKLPGSSLSRVTRLLETLRKTTGGVSPSDLAFVMDSAGLDPLAYRDLDAAARAYVDSNDAVPLARLVREAYVHEEGAGGPPRDFSQGLFVAASCSDNPQAYDMRTDPATRATQWHSALARKQEEDPDLYAPFTIAEFVAMPPDYAYLPLCLPWPVPAAAHPPGQPVPRGVRFPDVPTLVLTGDLDTTTPPGEGAAAARLFPSARHVIVANTGHVSALGDVYGCASSIVRRFTETSKVEAGCATKIPALHLVPSFALSVDDVIAPHPSAGNHAALRELRAAAAATLAAADVLARAYEFSLTAGSGLRGGTFTAQANGGATIAALAGIAWTRDLFVSGTASSNVVSARASAHLAVSGASTGTLAVSWTTVGTQASATMHGVVDGQVVEATMAAP